MIFLQYLKTLAICRGVCFIGLTSAFAQTTEFNYQGRPVDGSLPANTPHDFEFRLFPVNTGGTVLTTTQRVGLTR